MTPSTTLLSSIFVGASVGLLAWLVLHVLARYSYWLRSLRAIPQLRSKASRQALVFAVCRAVRPWVAAMVQPSLSLQGRLHLLGFPPDFDEASWLALKCVSAIVFPVVGFFVPDLWMRGQVTLERDKALRGFPALLDGLALSLEAGQSFAQAMRITAQRAVESAPDRWRSCIATFALEIRTGTAKAEAVSRLQTALPLPVVQQFGALVLVADQAGLSMGKILRSQASQARRLYQLEIEERAMKAPVKLMGPLVCCIFPCTFIVLLGPLLIKLTESLGVGL
jgi:pilus assembly protein TadC